jgi:hypothetical protein
MAITNYQIGLQRKYARWLGERIELQKEIKAIEEAAESLDAKKQRLAHIDKLTEATEIVLSELDPDWDPRSVQPQMTNRQVLPWEHGATTTTAYDIIRELGEPISTLELSKLTIAKLGGDPDDRDLLDRVRSNLDASLRNAKDHIRNVGGRPSRWQVIPADQMVMPKAPS